MSVDDRDLGWNKIKAEAAFMNGSFTKVGVQQGETHKSKDGELSDLAVIAAVNEFGTKRIPSRPFMRNAFDANQSTLFRISATMYSEVMQGKRTIKNALEYMGEFMTSKVKKSIKNTLTPVNAPSTIARKKSSHPLIDTGQLLQSISHMEVMK